MTKAADDIFYELLQLIPSGVGIYDVSDNEVRKVYLNDGYYQMIGADKDARHRFDGNMTVNAIHGDDIMGLLTEAHAAIKEKRLLTYSFRVLDGDGGYRWVAIRANHMPQEDGSERFFASYYDIDEMVRTRDKLRANELLYSDILAYSETSHFIYYPKLHRYETAMLPDKLKNVPTAMDDYPERFISYTNMSAVDADSYREMVRRIDEGKEEADCTVQMYYENRYGWYRVHLKSFFDEDGSPARAIGTAINVDQFMEAENAFNKEKLRMQTIRSGMLATSCFNVSKDENMDLNNDEALSYGDPADSSVYEEAIAADPIIAKQNPDTLRVLLYAAEQIPNREQRKKFLMMCNHSGMLRMYEEGKRDVTIEYRRRTGRGLIWVSTRIVFRTDPKTRDILAFYYTSDINDRIIYRKISEKLIGRDCESVFYYDMRTGCMYRKKDGVEFCKTGLESTLEELIFAEASPEEAEELRRELEIERVTEGLAENDVYSVFYTSVERDAEAGAPIRRMKCDAFYLDDEREIIVFVQSDVTAIFEQERKNRDELEKALKAAEDANRAKTEFLSRISHDIRTPISIISSMTEFASQDKGDADKLEHDLERIKSANTFLLSLINDVLDISKIDSGNIELVPEPYPFSEYMANIRNMFEPLCAEKGIEFVVEPFTDSGVIFADKIRVNQIVLNILSNAVKYTPRGGRVTYRSKSRRLGDGKLIYGFEIEDTGIGMSEKFRRIMFEPFTQEYDNPARPKGISGTGLGLSIVKKMVDLMDGDLTVESEIGKGTKINCRIVFPDYERCRDYIDKTHAADRTVLSGRKLSGKILLVEDNVVNLEIAERIVGGFGFEIECAENGRTATEKFAASPPGDFTAILMDIQMPVMNGYEATEAIRAMERSDAKTVPIVAMTADAFNEAKARGYKAGMDRFIVKPLDPKVLRETLEDVAK